MKEQNNNLLFAVKEIITHARLQIYRVANSALLESYWKIGKLIVEDEQHGNNKAQYGENTLKILSEQLNREFGKGFDYTNLTNMRKFYLVFPILDAVRQELSWTHYRLLSRLDTSEKRNYYLQESIACNWNSRELQNAGVKHPPPGQ